MERLYSALLKGYSADIRPSITHTKPINVSVYFSLTQLIDMVTVLFYLKGFFSNINLFYAQWRTKVWNNAW